MTRSVSRACHAAFLLALSATASLAAGPDVVVDLGARYHTPSREVARYFGDVYDYWGRAFTRRVEFLVVDSSDSGQVDK